jgi:hypothetical protein
MTDNRLHVRLTAWRHVFFYHSADVIDHPQIERLLNVATDDDEIFTLEEFNHLKACTACFVQWRC